MPGRDVRAARSDRGEEQVRNKAGVSEGYESTAEGGAGGSDKYGEVVLHRG